MRAGFSILALESLVSGTSVAPATLGWLRLLERGAAPHWLSFVIKGVAFVPGMDGTSLLFYRQVPLLAERFNVAALPLPDDPDASMDDLVRGLAALEVLEGYGHVWLINHGLNLLDYIGPWFDRVRHDRPADGEATK